jgi:hypothetical protein
MAFPCSINTYDFVSPVLILKSPPFPINRPALYIIDSDDGISFTCGKSMITIEIFSEKNV